MDNVLLVFQKNPELGKVKTRLAASVGDEEALNIYQKLINHTKKVIDSKNIEKQIWYSSWVDESDVWESNRYQKYVQQGDDLGERMSHTFLNAFDHKNAKKVIIIGTDCAEISSEIIDDAFSALNEYDFVIGPANDGGYYLLGMNTFHPEVFNQIAWSTGSVFSATLEKIQTLNKRLFLLSTLNDVDTLNDWNKVKNLI